MDVKHHVYLLTCWIRTPPMEMEQISPSVPPTPLFPPPSRHPILSLCSPLSRDLSRVCCIIIPSQYKLTWYAPSFVLSLVALNAKTCLTSAFVWPVGLIIVSISKPRQVRWSHPFHMSWTCCVISYLLYLHALQIVFAWNQDAGCRPVTKAHELIVERA